MELAEEEEDVEKSLPQLISCALRQPTQHFFVIVSSYDSCNSGRRSTIKTATIKRQTKLATTTTAATINDGN